MSEIQFQPIEPKRLAFELRGLGKDREYRGIQMELNRAAIEVESYGERIAVLERDLAAAQAEIERERMRLVACGVVAMSDTPDSAKSAREMHPDYRSATLSDVERRVDECIKLRADLAAAQADREAAIQAEVEKERAGCVYAAAEGIRERQHYGGPLNDKFDLPDSEAERIIAAIRARGAAHD